MLPFACKCALYRPEQWKAGTFWNGMLKVLKCRKWDISTDKAHREDYKNVFLFSYHAYS